MSFQKAVLLIAVVFLILFLVLIGVALSNSTTTADWPPVVGSCPDYWVDLSGNGSQCFNSHHLGTCPAFIPTADDKKTMKFWVKKLKSFTINKSVENPLIDSIISLFTVNLKRSL